MNTMIMMKRALATTLLCGALAACSTTPDVPFLSGDDFGDEIAEVAKDWRSGSDRVESGEKDIRSGKKDLAKAEKAVRKARAKAEDHEDDLRTLMKRIDEAEALSRQASASGETGVMTDGPVLKALYEDERDLRKDVDKAIRDRKSAEKRVRRARDLIAKGEDKVQRGRREMRDAERDYARIAR